MKTYRVEINYVVRQSAVVEVEADSEDEALEKAEEIAPFQAVEDERDRDGYEIEEISSP